MLDVYLHIFSKIQCNHLLRQIFSDIPFDKKVDPKYLAPIDKRVYYGSVTRLPENLFAARSHQTLAIGLPRFRTLF